MRKNLQKITISSSYTTRVGREFRPIKVEPLVKSESLPREILSISEILGIDPEFYHFLKQGFERGLTRFDSWDLTLLPEHQLKAAAFAASIFKRGVLTSDVSQMTLTEKYEIVRTNFGSDGRYFKTHLLIADAELEKQWSKKLEEISAPHYIKTSEAQKNFAMVAEILNIWNQSKRSRHWLVIGGGLLSDVVMFAASLCHAHVVVVPTTILSSVDAAVGSKCGINFESYGKNQVGRFYAPECVLIDPRFWTTLPNEEVRSGIGEIAKHALLTGKHYWLNHIKGSPDRLQAVADVLFDALDVKVQIVQEDPFERSRRRLLNFGHTFGHALETLATEAKSPIAHGVCVAGGILFANLVAKKQSLLTDRVFDSIRNDLIDLEILPTKDQLNFFTKISDEKILNAIHQDKKQTSYNRDDSQWVLLTGTGEIANEQSGYLTSVRDSTLQQCIQEWKTLLCE